MPLGVILMNENTSSEMIEIMEEIQKFVPATQQMVSLPIVVLGSDQLTCEQARNSERHRKGSATTEECLEGLVPTVEDWHTKMNYYEESNSLLLFLKKRTIIVKLIHSYTTQLIQ